MSSPDESSVIRKQLQELREELDALERGRVEGCEGDGEFAALRRDLDELRRAIDACCRGPATQSRSCASASPDPPYPPYPPFPPYPPVAPFPPYPPYPPHCGCCAPAPCGCPKCTGHAAPEPPPPPSPPPPEVLSSSSSSSVRRAEAPVGRTFGVRMPTSSSSSRYVERIN